MKKVILSFLTLFFAYMLSAQETGDIYGLNFTTGTLKLASVNPENGTVNILNEEPLSSDQFASGNSDVNPNEGWYHYVRAGQLITADLATGDVLFEPILTCDSLDINPVNPISNIAYNWLDSTIYGLVHVNQNLWFANVDPVSGVITILSDGPISNDQYSSGVSDIDPLGGRYFFIRANRIVTVLISTGEIEQFHYIENPNDAVVPITNIAYDWFSGQIFGLNFVSSVWDNNGNTIAPAQLRLATVDPSNGNLTILSDESLSPDQFSSGVSDLDPLNRVYYYIRANRIYTVDILTGDLIQSASLSNPNSAIQPITNIGVYKDQIALPSAISDFEDQHTDLEVQFKNTSAYAHSLHWNFGDENESFDRHPIHIYNEPGVYEVTLVSENLEGEKDTLSRIITVEGAVVGFEEIRENKFNLFPNPASDYVVLRTTADFQGSNLTIFRADGQMIKQILWSDNNYQLDISAFEAGVYFISLELPDRKSSIVRRLIIARN